MYSPPMTGYLKYLEAQWKLATPPRKKNAPTVVSTFSSAGGSSLGYHMAGMSERLAVEWDKHKVETFKVNFPKVPLFYGDIHDLSAAEALRLSGLEPGELDIFDGSPPCQGFSLAGHRVLNDSRNTLFREYIRLLRGFKPKAFIFENVKGMTTGKMKSVFNDAMRELTASGYKVRAQIIVASNFGVPQTRPRLFITGIQNDLNKEAPVLHATRHPVTAGEACLGADTTVPARNLHTKYKDWWGHIPIGKAANAVDPRPHQGFTSLTKLDPAKPSPTLRALTTTNGYGTAVHWREKRPISVGEAKRLSSFPDGYQILPSPQNEPGEYVKAWEAVGDCVPPFVAAEVARQVLEVINATSRA